MLTKNLFIFVPFTFTFFCTVHFTEHCLVAEFRLIIRVFDLRCCDLRLTLGRASQCSLILVFVTHNTDG